MNPEQETIEVEIRREADSLRGVMIQEGRAASGGRAELFTPDSIMWPAEGVEILLEHRGKVAATVIPQRAANGEIRFSTPLSPDILATWEGGKRHLSIEFVALAERRVKAGIREVSKALVRAAALVSAPEYDSAVAEVRDKKRRRWR